LPICRSDFAGARDKLDYQILSLLDVQMPAADVRGDDVDVGIDAVGQYLHRLAPAGDGVAFGVEDEPPAQTG
jgi:hypothetical protein